MMNNLQLQNDIERLLSIMPQKVVCHLSNDSLADVIEIVLDIGRPAEIRHSGGKIDRLGSELIADEDINFVTSHLQEFTHDNRSGIPGTLHRISAIRNRQGKVVGLTCRIGRVVTGTIACIKDICTQGKSILFLGRPGVGKTTKLREISRLVADEMGKRVVVDNIIPQHLDALISKLEEMGVDMELAGDSIILNVPSYESEGAEELQDVS